MLVLRPCCPRCGRSAPAGCACSRRCARRSRPGRSGSARAASAGRLGRRLRQAARRHGGRGAVLGRPRPRSATVGAHIVAIFLFARRGAAADRRLGRGGPAGDDRLGAHHDAAAVAPRAAHAAPRAGARRGARALEAAPASAATTRRAGRRRARVLVGPSEPDLSPRSRSATRPSRRASEPEPGARARAGAEPEPAEPRLAEDPETDEPGVDARAELARTDPLTPQGRYRAEVTDSPDFVWTVPDPRFLKRSSEDASAARHGRPGEGRRPARRGARPLRRRGAGDRHGRRARTSRATSCAWRPGIKVAKVAQLKDDLAYALAASDIRILAPIPGKQAVGVEVPNARRRIVHLGDVFQAPPPDWSPLTVWLGKDVAGRAIGADLAKMPHLLVAGTTGAGKSGCVNAMLSLDPAARDAARGADGARRPQAGRAQPLRLDPAPAHAGDHVARARPPRRCRTSCARWSSATRTCRSPARARCVELNKVRERRGEAPLPVRPVRDRRARRPDDGRARRRRGLDHPHRPEGARGRHPPRARHPVARASTSSPA